MWFLWKDVKPTDICHWLTAICDEKAPAMAAVHEWYLNTPKEWFHETRSSQEDGRIVQPMKGIF
jgi:hypothetical protein